MSEPAEQDWDEPLPDAENWPWCECDLEPTEDEEAMNQCAHCGKPIA